jgi:hypothetical protein
MPPLYFLNVCTMLDPLLLLAKSIFSLLLLAKKIFSLLLWCPFPEIVCVGFFFFTAYSILRIWLPFFHFTHNLKFHSIFVVCVQAKYEAMSDSRRLYGRVRSLSFTDWMTIYLYADEKIIDALGAKKAFFFCINGCVYQFSIWHTGVSKKLWSHY